MAMKPRPMPVRKAPKAPMAAKTPMGAAKNAAMEDRRSNTTGFLRDPSRVGVVDVKGKLPSSKRQARERGAAVVNSAKGLSRPTGAINEGGARVPTLGGKTEFKMLRPSTGTTASKSLADRRAGAKLVNPKAAPRLMAMKKKLGK